MGGTRSADGEEKGVYRDLVGKPEGKIYWRDPGVVGKIILY
jgi:DsbC/DsbD-like thiol-disulfide interchange protein